MSAADNSTIGEKIRLFVYKQSWWIVFLCSAGIAWILFHFGYLDTIVDHAETLAVTGVAVAAFQFSAQSMLMSASSENRFIREVRHEGKYFPFIHKFCRRSEIVFSLLLIPMLFMEKGEKNAIYNIASFSLYLYGLIFTIWTMWLIGRILTISERNND